MNLHNKQEKNNSQKLNSEKVLGITRCKEVKIKYKISNLFVYPFW